MNSQEDASASELQKDVLKKEQQTCMVNVFQVFQNPLTYGQNSCKFAIGEAKYKEFKRLNWYQSDKTCRT